MCINVLCSSLIERSGAFFIVSSTCLRHEDAGWSHWIWLYWAIRTAFISGKVEIVIKKLLTSSTCPILPIENSVAQ